MSITINIILIIIIALLLIKKEHIQKMYKFTDKYIVKFHEWLQKKINE